jgi:hypothetical protein
MTNTNQVVYQQATLNARSLHIWCVVDDQLSRGGQITMMYGYHLEQAHFSDAGEYWSQHYRRGFDPGIHVIGPIHMHIGFLSVTMPV